MSAKLKSLITIGYVTDHDCGNYYLGELDSLVQVGALEEFLKLHGDKGAKDLMNCLAWLCKRIGDEVYNYNSKQVEKDKCKT